MLVQDVKAKKAQWERGYCRDKLYSRSYIIEVDGQLLHRNRQFLKPCKNLPTESATHAELQDAEAKSGDPQQEPSDTDLKGEMDPPARWSSDASIQLSTSPKVSKDLPTSLSTETVTNKQSSRGYGHVFTPTQ